VINPFELEKLFESAHSPLQAKEFVDAIERDAPQRPKTPIDLILTAIEKQSATRAPVSIRGLPMLIHSVTGGQYDFAPEEVSSMIEGLRALAPTTLWADGEWVALQSSPEQVKAEIRSNLEELGTDRNAEGRKALGV
jgi:hypothetical protein